MQLYALGLNHNTAPLAIREQMVFHAEKLQSALRELTQTKLVGEAAILSTCNRTELYCSSTEPHEALYWMAEYHRMKPQELKPYVYTLPKEQAVRHAFRVASGLESMVLGEPQILGQMKEAVRLAESAGTLGTLLHKLFQRSFAVAKEVRTNTQIGANVVAMAAASVKLAARIFPSLKEQKILFIGAGEMIELCATHFAAQLDHLAGADEQDLLLLQAGENACGKLHRRRRHRHHVGADLGVGAHFLGHCKRALEQLVQQRPESAGRFCQAHRLLHLAQDLRLAQHHGFEARGDAKRVAHRLFLGQGVEVRLQLLRLHAVILGHPEQRFVRLLGGTVELGAVAGGEDRRLPHQLGLGQFAQRRFQFFGVKHHLLADRERSGVVVQAEGVKLHLEPISK